MAKMWVFLGKTFAVILGITFIGSLGYMLALTKTTSAPPCDKVEKAERPGEPKIVYRVYIESPKIYWEPHPGYYDDVKWYRWAEATKENSAACLDNQWCQEAMARLKQNGCLAPQDNRFLDRCNGKYPS